MVDVNFKLFMSLLVLADESAIKLGLGGLSEADENLLKFIWRFSDEGNRQFDLTYDSYLKASVSKTLSRAQFFKSLSTLIEKKILVRLEGARSKRYKLIV